MVARHHQTLVTELLLREEENDDIQNETVVRRTWFHLLDLFIFLKLIKQFSKAKLGIHKNHSDIEIFPM